MILFKKGVFKDWHLDIDSWDEPKEREFDGRLVKGRPTKGYGSSSFEYAGKLYEPTTWTPQMYEIKVAAERVVKEELDQEVSFTFCLCGYYGIDGKGIPHHSDTVPTLDDLIVSISFGAPRVFEIEHFPYDIKKHTNTSEVSIPTPRESDKVLYLLEHGDVIIFDGQSQMRATHAVPNIEGASERINLTFRSGL
tara:strand:- start:720 stop:1301 length:582 start_codon:yes stop_codon:yes gene_type:complete